MDVFGKDGAAIEWRRRHETVLIGPWGADSFRVRGPLWQGTRDDLPGVLLPSPPSSGAVAQITPDVARVVNGRLTAEISADGHLRFARRRTAPSAVEGDRDDRAAARGSSAGLWPPGTATVGWYPAGPPGRWHALNQGRAS